MNDEQRASLIESMEEELAERRERAECLRDSLKSTEDRIAELARELAKLEEEHKPYRITQLKRELAQLVGKEER